MKAAGNVVDHLNTQLTNELTAINQYFLHARTLRHWGVTMLGKKEYDESIGEMRHADKLVHRILFLDGLPNLQDLHKLSIGETVPEALAVDLALEYRSRETLVASVTMFEAKGDYVSRELVTKILHDTEEHIDYLETQHDLLRALGEQNYLQSAAGELSE